MEQNMQQPKNGGGWCSVIFGCLIAFVFVAGGAGLLIIDALFSYKGPSETIDQKTNGAYCVMLIADGSPEWPFGPQDGRILLERDGSKIAEASFSLANDGKYMGADNWRVEWQEDAVLVTISGEEQPDEQLMLYYAGGHKERSRS